MQISTKALSVILISFLGGSQTAHAIPYEDAYGVTHYGFQCQDRFYTKPVIYAAAKNLCDKNSRQSKPHYPTYSSDGYRSPLGYDLLMDNEAAKLFDLFYSYTPIFTDGTLFAFESDSPKKASGKSVRIDPGPDRLVVDSRCNVMGAFTDKDYKKDTDKPRVKACWVIESKEDKNRFVRSSGRYQQRSREHSPERSQEIPPERTLQLHPQRSREHSPERSQEIPPERTLQMYPQRSREHSPERSQEIPPERTLQMYPQRSREHSPERSQEIPPERTLQMYPQRSREHSPERSQEIPPERTLQMYPQRSREHSPERSQEIPPERTLQMYPQRSREHSPERSQEIPPERTLQMYPQRSREHSPERSQENTP